MLQQVLGQQVRHLDGDPLAGVVAAEEGDPAGAAAALTDAQRPQRPVLDAAADLVQLGDLRVCLGETAQVLLQGRHRVVPGRVRREGRQVLLGHPQLLDVVAHGLQPAGLGLVRLQDQVVGPHLPHVQPEGGREQAGERSPGTRGRDSRDQARHRTLRGDHRAPEVIRRLPAVG